MQMMPLVISHFKALSNVDLPLTYWVDHFLKIYYLKTLHVGIASKTLLKYL